MQLSQEPLGSGYFPVGHVATHAPLSKKKPSLHQKQLAPVVQFLQFAIQELQFQMPAFGQYPAPQSCGNTHNV